MMFSTFDWWLYLDGFAHRHPRLIPGRLKRWIGSQVDRHDEL